MQTPNTLSNHDRTSSGQNRPPDFITRISILLCFASFLLTVGLLLFYPYGANYGEAPLLDQARHITAGENIYKPSLQLSPYVIANYTPLYPLLVGMLFRLTHIPLYPLGRMISILAAITSSLLIGSFAQKIFGSPFITGFIAAGLFLGHPYTGLWSGLARVDSLALAFSLAGLWIVCFRWRSTPWLAAALACLLASVFTRQTYLLAAPFACAVWLYYNDRKRCFMFLAAFAILGLGTFLIVNGISHGGFYQHIVIANVNRYSFGRMLSMGMLYLITAPGFLILAILSVRRIFKQKVAPTLLWCLLPYTTGALLTALTVGKIGSDINYFLEFTCASAIWATGLWRGRPNKLTTSLLIFHTGWVVAFSGLLFQAPLVKLWKNIPQVDTLARLVNLAALQGPVLADDRLDLVVLAGQAIYFQPFEYTQLYSADLWHPESFISEIKDHKFPLILIQPAYQKDRWPELIYDAIQQNYTCKKQASLLVCSP